MLFRSVGAALAPLAAPLAVAGALAGGVKWLVDRKNAQKQREIESAKTLFSPWTGVQVRDVEGPNLMGNLIQGGLAGAQFGQGIQQYQQSKDMNDAWMRYLERAK